MSGSPHQRGRGSPPPGAHPDPQGPQPYGPYPPGARGGSIFGAPYRRGRFTVQHEWPFGTLDAQGPGPLALPHLAGPPPPRQQPGPPGVPYQQRDRSTVADERLGDGGRRRRHDSSDDDEAPPPARRRRLPHSPPSRGSRSDWRRRRSSDSDEASPPSRRRRLSHSPPSRGSRSDRRRRRSSDSDDHEIPPPGRQRLLQNILRDGDSDLAPQPVQQQSAPVPGRKQGPDSAQFCPPPETGQSSVPQQEPQQLQFQQAGPASEPLRPFSQNVPPQADERMQDDDSSVQSRGFELDTIPTLQVEHLHLYIDPKKVYTDDQQHLGDISNQILEADIMETNEQEAAGGIVHSGLDASSAMHASGGDVDLGPSSAAAAPSIFGPKSPAN